MVRKTSRKNTDLKQEFLSIDREQDILHVETNQFGAVQNEKKLFFFIIFPNFYIKGSEFPDICESLNIESLILRLERSQLRWYGHVTRMSQERTAKKLLCSTPIDQRPRTRWRDYVEDLSWFRLGIPARASMLCC